MLAAIRTPDPGAVIAPDLPDAAHDHVCKSSLPRRSILHARSAASGFYACGFGLPRVRVSGVSGTGSLEASEAALSADPDAQSLAAPFGEALEEWDGIFKRERAARREVIRAEAVVGVRNEQLDALTTRFAAMVRGVAASLLQKLFTMAPGRFIRRGLRVQCEKTRDVILVELAKLDASHPLQPFVPQLQGATGGALAALDARSTAKGARQTTANDVDEWKEGVNALRTTTYAELLKIATEKGYPKSWVESFFRSASSGGDAEGEEPAEPPAAADPARG